MYIYIFYNLQILHTNNVVISNVMKQFHGFCSPTNVVWSYWIVNFICTLKESHSV